MYSYLQVTVFAVQAANIRKVCLYALPHRWRFMEMIVQQIIQANIKEASMFLITNQCSINT